MADEIELACIVKHATEKALLVDLGDREQWIPRSVLQDGTDVEDKGDEGVVVLPAWFAKKEGLE